MFPGAKRRVRRKKIVRCGEFIAFTFAVITGLALIMPIQVAFAQPAGTVEFEAIRKDTGELLGSSGLVSFYIGDKVFLRVSFFASESVSGISPLVFPWVIILRVVKVVAGGIAAVYGSGHMDRWWGVALVGAGTAAVTFKSVTDFEWSVDFPETWTFDLNATMYQSVGGIVVSIDKFGLLAPYIGLGSTILVATATIGVYDKRVKHRKGKQ